MAIAVYPVTPSFAAEIGDIDLSEQIAPADLQAIKEAFTQYAVLIFPNQHLSQDQHLDFARYFGIRSPRRRSRAASAGEAEHPGGLGVNDEAVAPPITLMKSRRFMQAPRASDAK
jgi:alpha-ketoglutarate-dependent taurine dioxygenase